MPKESFEFSRTDSGWTRPAEVPPARDGTGLLEQFRLGGRARWGFCSLSGPERQRLFLVLTPPGRPGGADVMSAGGNP